MIKIIAYVAMLLDHVGKTFFPDEILLAIVGRLAFPLFAYGIVKGFSRTNNFRKYAMRILLLAIISQVPYGLLFQVNYLNVCFTLLAGLFVLKILATRWSIPIKMLLITFICFVSVQMNFEYGIYGIATIVIFHKIKNVIWIILFQTLFILQGISSYQFDKMQLLSLFSIIVIFIFRNRFMKFRINKIIQYSFYPVHMIILIVLKQLIK
ncbi:TraX family protein [Paenibacillus sp. SC116]|uniref:TraX family protein n=1 Tax=Paenibacillus sp. SC116 TaxID=2968986 RepID=UPI0035C69850